MANQNNTWKWVLGILFVLALVAWGMFPRTVSDTVTEQELQAQISDLTAALKAEQSEASDIEYVNVTNTIEVANADQFKEQALADITHELRNDDEFLTCDGYEYDSNEVTVSTVEDFTYSWTDFDDRDTDYEVTLEGKFKFKTEDEKACTEWRTYKVTYEQDEDPSVELISRDH